MQAAGHHGGEGDNGDFQPAATTRSQAGKKLLTPACIPRTDFSILANVPVYINYLELCD